MTAKLLALRREIMGDDAPSPECQAATDAINQAIEYGIGYVQPPRKPGIGHLPPERRAEIARAAGLARNTPERKAQGRRGPLPCHTPNDPNCLRCRRRASEQLSRKRKIEQERITR